jgi:hypothetical protein
VAQRTSGGATEMERAISVAEHVFALPEPWRSRFLTLIAQYAQGDRMVGQPTEEEVLGWLRDDELSERIRLMLRSWTHST